MKDIDEMDMVGYIRLRAWNANREKEKNARSAPDNNAEEKKDGKIGEVKDGDKNDGNY